MVSTVVMTVCKLMWVKGRGQTEFLCVVRPVSQKCFMNIGEGANDL